MNTSARALDGGRASVTVAVREHAWALAVWAAMAAWTERYEGLTRESEILGRHAVLAFARPPAMAVAPG